MNIPSIVSQMTLEEKAGFLSGRDMWHLKPLERFGIPALMVTDGPHGLRKQVGTGDHLGLNDSVPAVCFPTAAALACSFDAELLTEVGSAIGEECQAEDVSVILGPGTNIKRSPLCGRNFEYFSEDPFLAGRMAAAHIQGVQRHHVGTSLKHFMGNSQEYRRMTSSSQIDERTMREIYLPAFETAVKDARPWTVMCSYNRINGVYGCENPYTLTDILRDEWGFEGYVMTDWGAMNDKIASIKAGLELEMPGGSAETDQKVIDAVKSGALDEALLDRAVTRILNVMVQYMDHRRPETKFNYSGDHALARRVESECAVLLKNDGVLPLKPGTKVAVIGQFAEKPRYQGGGSSHINPCEVTNALSAMAEYGEVTYAQGYVTDRDEEVPELVRQAVDAAKAADVAVIFAGLPDAFESEGYDRTHIDMPNCQNALISAVAAAQKRTVVVLHNGSVIRMPWLDEVSAVLEAYLGGQAVGGACADLLFGKVNPSGKLAETFPLRVQDNPSYLNYGGYNDVVEYREGVYVGYRYYDAKEMPVLFPFGYGLSYTTFEYSDLQLSAGSIADTDMLRVSCKITNTGSVAGKEIAQLYVSEKKPCIGRPPKELKGFAKVHLEPGETKTVTFTLDKRSFAFYDVDLKDWRVNTGEFAILVGASSRDIRLTGEVHVDSTTVIRKKLHMNSTLSDLMETERGRQLVGQLTGDMANDPEIMMMMGSAPVRSLVGFSGGRLTTAMAQQMLDYVNGADAE